MSMINTNISKSPLYSFIALLTGVYFFGINIVPNAIVWLLLPFSLLSLVRTYKYDFLFKKYIYLFMLFAFLSSVSCYVFRGQSFFLSFKAPGYREYFVLLSYFIYINLRPKPVMVEKIIIFSFGIFFFLYYVQSLLFPFSIIQIIAGKDSERLRVIGQVVNSLVFFMSLNRWLLNKGLINILYMLCCLYVFFILGFRMMFAALFISSSIMFVKLFGFKLKKIIGVSVMVIVIGGVLSQTSLVKQTIQDMIERQETDNFDNDDYIRIAQLGYYIEDHFKSRIEWLFGSGQPHASSKYGKYMKFDETHDAMLRGGCLDWGLIGQSWLVGPVTIIIFIIMMIKCIRISWQSDKHYFYIAAWYIFLLIISVNNMEVHRQGSMAYHALVFYLVASLHKQHKYQLKLQAE